MISLVLKVQNGNRLLPEFSPQKIKEKNGKKSAQSMELFGVPYLYIKEIYIY